MVSESAAVEEIIVEELDRACLEQALTTHEVSALYGKNQKTVYDLCVAGKLVARRASVGATWIISKRSCDERWGNHD